jgi:hypothetical protein
MAHSNSDIPASAGEPALFRLSASLQFKTLVWSEKNALSPLDVSRLFRSAEPIESWVRPVLCPLTYEEAVEAEDGDETVVRRRFQNGIGDSPFETTAYLLFSGRAVERLNGLLERSGELLPVYVEDCTEDFYAFHCCTVLDVIDIEASRVERYECGLIRRIVEPVFRGDLETAGKVFRINCPNYFMIFADRHTASHIVTTINGLELTEARLCV